MVDEAFPLLPVGSKYSYDNDLFKVIVNLRQAYIVLMERSGASHFLFKQGNKRKKFKLTWIGRTRVPRCLVLMQLTVLGKVRGLIPFGDSVFLFVAYLVQTDLKMSLWNHVLSVSCRHQCSLAFINHIWYYWDIEWILRRVFSVTTGT